jgi:uncharacterized protein YcfJ
MWVKGLLAAAVAGALISGTAAAHDGRGYDGRGHGGRDVVYARVVSARPIVRHVTVERPRRECWDDVEYRSDRPARVAGPTLAGGIIGAAIGRQFGGGSGRDALTLLGGIAGSAVAHERAGRRLAANGGSTTYAVPVERCTVVNERFTEEIIGGYDVVYQYQGRRYSMHTARHPGDRVPLQVNFRPVRY